MKTKNVVAICIILALALAGLGMPKNSYANLTRIKFPVNGGELPSNVNYSIDPSVTFSDEKIKPGSPESDDYVFPFSNLSASDEKITKLKQLFNLESSQKRNSRDATIYENEAYFLRINDDGTYVYHNKKRDDDTSMLLSDEISIKIAKDFLTKNNLFPSGFFENGVAHETVTSALNSKNSKVLRKEVYFNRNINGKPVYGISRIIVAINQTGDIDSVYSVYKDYHKEEAVKIVTFDQALLNLKNHKGLINMSETTKNVIIKKVELAYWEDSSPNSKQTHIQPIYRFIGESEDIQGEKGVFEGIVAAVPDNLTTPEPEPEIKSTPKVPNIPPLRINPGPKPENLR